MYILANGKLITRGLRTWTPASRWGSSRSDPASPYSPERTGPPSPGRPVKAKYPDAEFIDAKGGVIMPGLVNAHTHIYSALARGLSINGFNPTNFYEVLDGQWWYIDRHLTLKGTKASADALYLDCIKQGVTTIFDHHASFAEIPGSLFQIADSAKEFGIRSCLCYEVSDRDGQEKADRRDLGAVDGYAAIGEIGDRLVPGDELTVCQNVHVLPGHQKRSVFRQTAQTNPKIFVTPPEGNCINFHCNHRKNPL